jgi:hypothetical protein
MAAEIGRRGGRDEGVYVGEGEGEGEGEKYRFFSSLTCEE